MLLLSIILSSIPCILNASVPYGAYNHRVISRILCHQTLPENLNDDTLLQFLISEGVKESFVLIYTQRF